MPWIVPAVFFALPKRVASLPLTTRETGTNITGVSVSQTLYQAAALGAVTIAMVGHQTLRNNGFNFRQKRSTDVWVQCCVLLGTAVWVALVGISMTLADDRPCSYSVSACLDRASHMPWVLIGYALCFCAAHAHIPGIWNYPTQSPTYESWSTGLAVGGHILLYAPIVVGFSVGGYGNWQEMNYVPAVLNMTALAMMALEVFGTNPYSQTPERATGCIVMFNTADASVAGIFVATDTFPHLHTTLGPRPIACASEADTIIQDMNRRVETGECDIGGIHATVRSFQKAVGARVAIGDPELAGFCGWMDGVGESQHIDRLRWIRPKGGNSISRETCLMLVLAEYCIHQARRRENKRPKNTKLGWRTKRQGGMVGNATESIYGGMGGIRGFMDAHAKICSLIGAEYDANLAGDLSAAAVKETGQTFDVGRTWDEALENADTTIMAMYAFYTKWFATYGSTGGQVLHPVTRSGTFARHVASLILWRQPLFTAASTQLAIVLPAVISALLVGIL